MNAETPEFSFLGSHFFPLRCQCQSRLLSAHVAGTMYSSAAVSPAAAAAAAAPSDILYIYMYSLLDPSHLHASGTGQHHRRYHLEKSLSLKPNQTAPESQARLPDTQQTAMFLNVCPLDRALAAGAR